MNCLRVEITITGSHLDGFTAAELWCITEDEEHFIGRVFEQEDGWHYDLLSSVAELGISHNRFTMEVERAKEALGPYINRKGTNPPTGLSRRNSRSG
jgi:hypothetical protein